MTSKAENITGKRSERFAFNRFCQTARKSLVGFLKHYPRGLALIWRCDPKGSSLFIIATLLSAITAPVELYISKNIIDLIVGKVQAPSRGGGSSVRVLLGLLSLQIVVWLVASVMHRWLEVLRDIQGTKLSQYIHRVALEKVSRLDIAFFESPTFYDKFHQVLNRSSRDAYTFLTYLGSMTCGSVTLLSMFIILWHLNPLVVPVLLIVSLPHVYFRARFTGRRFEIRAQQGPALRMVNYLNRLLTSRETVSEMRLYSCKETLLHRLDQIWGRFVADNRALLISEQGTQLLLSIGPLVCVGGVGLYAMMEALAGRLTVGAMMLYFGAAKSVTEGLEGFFAVGGAVYESGLSLRELFEFLDMKPDSVEGALKKAQGNPLSVPCRLQIGIEFRHVSFRYPGTRKHVLEDVSFKISAGERVAFVGPNGAGKTTVVKLLTRLYDPTEGEILLEGRRLDEYDLEGLRALFGVLVQDFTTYHFSVRDNIGFGNVAAMHNADLLEKAARDAGCLAMIERLPKGFDTVLGRTMAEGVDLSRGEWQKLALARAFMRNAGILILDEPSASMDPIAEEQLFRGFEDLMAAKTCIVISHRFSTIHSMNRVLVLQEGRLIEQGSHHELMVSSGTYCRMYRLQASRYSDQTNSALA